MAAKELTLEVSEGYSYVLTWICRSAGFFFIWNNIEKSTNSSYQVMPDQ